MLSICSEVQIVCIWSSWCHCIPKPHHLLPHLNPDWFYLSCTGMCLYVHYYICWHTLFNGFFPGLPRWAGTRKVKPIWILLKQETVSGSGISWAICKSAPGFRQITTPAPHHSVFYRPDALPAAQPTASKHWRYICWHWIELNRVPVYTHDLTLYRKDFQLLHELMGLDRIGGWVGLGPEM